MPATVLTARFCEGVKPTPKRQISYPDAQVRGLEFRVSGDGRKSWSFRYRTADGKQKRLSLGPFPAVDLAAARTAALKTVADVAQGGDPVVEKRLEKEKAEARALNTFDSLAEAYFEACERGEWQPKGKPQRLRTIADSRACHRRYVTDVIGKTPVSEIGRTTIRQLLRGMAAKGIEAQTKRTHAFIRQVFAWAIAEFDDEVVRFNPAVGFSPIGRVKPRARVYSDAELRTLWNGLKAPETLTLDGVKGPRPIGVSRQMGIIVQLVAVTLQRKAEVAGMHEQELDLVARTWLIPGERTKSGWPQLVPLTSLAIDLIEEAKRLSRRIEIEEGAKPSNAPRLIFPARNNLETPVRGDSITHAMRKVVPALGLSNLTVHDLRRTGSTLMTSERLRVTPFIRSKVLGHRSDAGGGAAVSMLHYDANEYVSDKRDALERWARLLRQIVDDGGPDRAANENTPLRSGSGRSEGNFG
jgi:integrase